MKVPHLGLRMVRERTLNLPEEWVQNANQAASIATRLIGKMPTEHVIAILVNGSGRVTGVTTLAQGGMLRAAIKVSDVLRAVLAAHASAFVLAHNHPSGEPEPSESDMKMTADLALAAKIVGVPLLDHVVVTASGDYRSIAVA